MLLALSALSAAAQEVPPTEELAAAEEPPPADLPPQGPEVIEIPPVEERLPSALDSLSGADRNADGDVDLPHGGLGSLVRSRLSVHPLAGWTTLLGTSGGHALSLGGALGHQLYTLDALPVKLGLDSRVEGSAPVGDARGHRLDARTSLSSWFGPLGLSLGPTLRWDRQAWSAGPELPPALLVGASLGLSLDTGPLQPRIGVAPAAVVVGDRGGARDPGAPPPILPVLLDETTWQAGLRWSGRPVQLGVDAGLRASAIGPALEASLSLHLRPF